MLEFFGTLPQVLQALLGGVFCFACTTLGASFVFFVKNSGAKFLTALLASAGGIMIASSFFSLLQPALEYCDGKILEIMLFCIIGFLAGGSFIALSNIFIDKKINFQNPNLSKHKRNILLVSSITLHNIPEGMAIGVAFGSCLSGEIETVVAAFLLAIGIGVQNIPEGASVSIPLCRDGVKSTKSFVLGMLSGAVEPFFAVLACMLAMVVQPALPFLLAFSAGAMMTVAVIELIPESLSKSKNLSILFLALGFCIMAFLDNVLG